MPILGKTWRPLRSWTWLVLAWMVLSTGLWLSQRGQVAQALADAALLAQLDWRPGLWPTQPWRLWTAALVHWSDAHLVVNLLACAALIAWGNAAVLGNRQTLAWLAAWPVTHVLLAGLAPLERYGGLSGVLHAGVAIGAWTLVWRGQGQRRVVGGLVIAGLVLKQAIEVPALAQWLGLGPVVLPRALAGAPDFQVASYAHLCGVAAGVICAAAMDALVWLLAGTGVKR
jgi:membrane associated rhomboid family serine protease